MLDVWSPTVREPRRSRSPRLRCPQCGSTSIKALVTHAANLSFIAQPPTRSATQPTDAVARLRKVQAAVDDMSDPNREANLEAALPYVMTALEGGSTHSSKPPNDALAGTEPTRNYIAMIYLVAGKLHAGPAIT
jgi:hypothetical protein